MTRRLHALYVGNFKAFGKTQRIPLKPITLVFGPNSAGKSSFIHSLALAHEAQFGRERPGLAHLDIHHTEVGGGAIDLGGFRQFVHRKQFHKGVEWAAELKVSELAGYQARGQIVDFSSHVDTFKLIVRLGIELNHEDVPVKDAVPYIESVEIQADGEELIYMSRRDKASAVLGVIRLASDHAVFRKMLHVIAERDTESTALNKHELDLVDGWIADLLPDFEVNVRRFLPSSVKLSRLKEFELSREYVRIPRRPRSERILQRIESIFPLHLNNFVVDVCSILAEELHGFRYLGPLRTLPPRHVAFQQLQDESWNSGGNFAFELLRKDERLREKVNEWLAGHQGRSRQDALKESMLSEFRVKPRISPQYILEVARFYSVSDLKDPLISAFNESPSFSRKDAEALKNDPNGVLEFLTARSEATQSRATWEVSQLRPLIDRFQLAQSEDERKSLIRSVIQVLSENSMEEGLDRSVDEYEDARSKAWNVVQMLEECGDPAISELYLRDVEGRTNLSLRDVGVGISQVLPVLALAYGSKEQLVAIEQPEIHLHPALQADLADVFIEAALGESKNTFILETHSEHLILRLMRRIREGKLSPDDVGVMYIEPMADSSRILELRIDEEGDFIDEWPGGFFEESFHEKFAGR
jgi:hypothetical protein